MPPMPRASTESAQTREGQGLYLFTWAEKGKGEGMQALGQTWNPTSICTPLPLPPASDGPWASLSGKVMASGLKQLSHGATSDSASPLPTYSHPSPVLGARGKGRGRSTGSTPLRVGRPLLAPHSLHEKPEWESEIVVDPKGLSSPQLPSLAGGSVKISLAVGCFLQSAVPNYKQ